MAGMQACHLANLDSVCLGRSERSRLVSRKKNVSQYEQEKEIGGVVQGWDIRYFPFFSADLITDCDRLPPTILFEALFLLTVAVQK
jgi:hypothetical protein